MTIALNPVTVAASIAALSVSGVTIKDIDEIPDSANMLCPLVVPMSNFITNITPQTQSFGSNGGAKIDFSYSLNYGFLYAEIGSGINGYAPYAGLMQKLELILETILGNDAISGLVDMKLESLSEVGTIEDPAGNQFWGVTFSLRCLEYAQ